MRKPVALPCFADKFGITHAHSFGTDTQHDYSQGNFFRVLVSKENLSF